METTEKKKKRGCSEENSLFAVHLHSNNTFHVLHSPCCIWFTIVRDKTQLVQETVSAT